MPFRVSLIAVSKISTLVDVVEVPYKISLIWVENCEN